MTTQLLSISGSDLAWAWQLGRGVIVTPDGQRWDLDADEYDPQRRQIPWSTVVSSLRSYLSRYRPAVLPNHEVGPTVLGTVERMRVLSKEEARELLGIEQEHPEAIYYGLDLQPEVRAAYDEGRALYMSPRIVAAYVANDGTQLPFVTPETSFTSIPVQQFGQTPTSSLRGLQLSYTSSTDMEDKKDETMAAPDMAAMEAMMQRIDSLEQRIAAMEEAKGSEMGEQADDAMSLVDRVSALETSLSAANQRAENAERVAGDLRDEATRATARERLSFLQVAEAKVDDLVELAVTTPAAFEVALSAIPTKPQRNASPVARSLATTPTQADLSLDGDRAALHSAALAYRVEHPTVSYSDALRAVSTH
jgi:TolA-binding protein